MKITAKNKGFTLIEMIVTVAILGILAAIAIPAYNGYKVGAARQEAVTNLQGLSLCLQQYYAENNQYTPAAGQAYNWIPNPPGPATNDFSGWLACFNPQAAAGSQNNYKYTVTTPNPTPNPPTFTATATPVSGPIINDGALTIDQAGDKTPPNKWP